MKKKDNDKKTVVLSGDDEGKVILETEHEDDTVIDALKELTKTVADLAKTVNAMKVTHDKWIMAGKF